MASFQVPQFLDSGDKIIFNLNLRQFGYALGGFLISMAIFGVVGGINPGLGLYAFLPAVPVMLISAYAALGRYNGRDADFYIVKFIIFVVKPKVMVFSRQPDNEDLNRKLSEYTEAKIKERWAARLVQNNQEVGDQFAHFHKEDSQSKASKIRVLGQAIDTNINNTNDTLVKLEYSQMARQASLRSPQLSPTKESLYPQHLPPFPIPTASAHLPKAPAVNFFAEPKQDEEV